MDLVVLLVASAFGGALVTTIVGIITFIMTGRREHRRWLYDLKYKNYLEMLRAWHHWQRLAKPGANRSDLDALHEIHHKITELVAADLILVNSVKVERSFTSLLDTMVKQLGEIESGKRTDYELEERWTKLVNAMRQDLGIKGRVTAGREYVETLPS